MSSYDVLYLSLVSDIVSKFLSKDAGILFGAEKWIWPKKDLESEYPEVKDGYRFLNSGGREIFRSQLRCMFYRKYLHVFIC